MNIEVDTTLGTVTLDISGTYTADQLRQVLQSICEARAQIAQEPASPVGHELPIVRNAAWHTSAIDGDLNTGLLAFLLPGFGWAAIALPNLDRCLLAHYMNGQVANALAATAATPTAAADLLPSGGGRLH